MAVLIFKLSKGYLKRGNIFLNSHLNSFNVNDAPFLRSQVYPTDKIVTCLKAGLRIRVIWSDPDPDPD